MSEKDKLLIRIEYKGVTEEISGNFDEVTRQTMKFLYNLAPKFSLLDKIKLEIEDDKLIEEIGPIMKITSDGLLFVKEPKGLKTSEIVIAYLVGAYLGYKLGILLKDSLTVGQLSTYTGSRKDNLMVMLSKMSKTLMIESGEVGERKITKNGLLRFKQDILPKLIEDSC